MLTAILTSIARELRFLRHGLWNLSLITWVPVLAILWFGILFWNSAPRQLPLLVADADNSATSRQLVRMLQSLPVAQVSEAGENFEHIREAVRNRETYAAVFIPQGMEGAIARGEQAHVYSFFNDIYYTSANFVQRDVTNAVSQFNATLAAARTGPPANRAADDARAIGAPVSVQATMLFNPANSYELGLAGSLIPAILLVLMGNVVTVSLVREMSRERRDAWLADARGSLLVAMGSKVFLYAAIYTALCTLGILWLRWRGWPVHGSMGVIIGAQFLMFLGNGFAMAVIAGASRGHMLPALSVASLYTGGGMAFGDILFPINTASWFTRALSDIMPFSSYMQVQAQQMQMGSPAGDSLVFVCRLGMFALAALLVGLVLIKIVLRLGLVETPNPKTAAFDADGRGGKGFARGVRMVWWAVKNEPGVAMVLLAATIIYSFYYPAAYTTQVAAHLPIAVVDLDNSAQSRGIVRKTMQLRAVEVAARPASLAEARRLIEQRKVDGVLLIGENFERDALTGRSGKLGIYGNNAFLVRCSMLMSALGEVAQEAAMDIAEPQFLKTGIGARMATAAAMPVKLVSRPLFNTREGYGSFAVPAVAQLVVQQAMFFGILMVLGRRRQRAEEAGLALPAMGAREFAGVFGVFALMGVANAAWMNGFAFWMQDYPRGANIAGLIAFTPVYVFALTAGAMFIGGFVDRSERALQFFTATSLPLFFAAGVSWPVEAMPRAMQWFTQLIPATPAISACAKLGEMGATFAEVRGEVLRLLVFGVVCTALAWLKLGSAERKARCKNADASN